MPKAEKDAQPAHTKHPKSSGAAEQAGGAEISPASLCLLFSACVSTAHPPSVNPLGLASPSPSPRPGAESRAQSWAQYLQTVKSKNNATLNGVPGWGGAEGWKPQLCFPFPHFPHPTPKLKTSTAALGHSQAGVPSLSLRSAKLSWARQAPRFIVLAPQPAGSPRPGALAAPWKGGWGGVLGSPIPYSSPRSNTGPFPPSPPSCQPIAKALKRNQAVSGRRGVGAVQMLGRGRRRRQGETGGCGRTKPQPSPTACSYLGSALPWFLCPDRARLGRPAVARLPALDAGAASSLALLLPRRGPVPCRQQKSPHSTHPNYFCPFGSWPWRSGDWWQWGAVTALALLLGPRLLAVGGSVPALGAVRSGSGCCCGAGGKEKGGENGWTKLSITSPNSHKYQRHTLPTSAHPQSVKRVTVDVL